MYLVSILIRRATLPFLSSFPPRPECLGRCEFSVKFNMDCCNSECPTAAGCPGATTGTGTCNNTLPGEVERRCNDNDDCTISTCANAADKTGQLCTEPQHCISLSRDAGNSGWFSWITNPTCDVDASRPGMCLFTEKPSSMPSVRPSGAPSARPSAAPTAAPSSSPSDVPSPMPTCSPSFEGPNCDIPAQTYSYTTNNADCNVRVTDGVNGPPIIEHEDNVVIKFWAFGDFPYDQEASPGNERACCDESGGLVGCTAGQDTCNANDCGTVPDQSNNACSFGGTSFRCAPGCVFEGREYDCWRDTIVPYMNANAQDSVASFAFFTGDFIKGDDGGNSGFCNPDSFASRRALFDQMNVDVLFSPGDNDWNECNGFGGNGNTNNNNVIRRMYRSFFTNETTFSRDFRSKAEPGYPARPSTIFRDAQYPELFYYVWNDVVFIGVSAPDGWDPPNGRNEVWVQNSLAGIATDYPNFVDATDVCNTIKSVVVLSHTRYFDNARSEVDAFFGTTCGRGGGVVPLLSVRGNNHSYRYCQEGQTSNTFEVVNGGDQGTSGNNEESDPHLVTILRNPRTGEHYFRVDRNDDVSNGCAGFN